MLFTSCRITGKKTNLPSIFHYQSFTKKCYSFMYFSALFEHNKDKNLPEKIISKNNISHSHTESFSEYPPPKKTRNQLPFLIVGFSSLIMVLT